MAESKRLHCFVEHVDEICKGLKGVVISVKTLLNYFSSSRQKLDNCLKKLNNLTIDVNQLKVQLIDCKTDLGKLNDAANILRKLFKDALDFGDLSETGKEEILKAAKEGNYDKMEAFLDALRIHLEACYRQYKSFTKKQLAASNSCQKALKEAGAKKAEAGKDAESLKNTGIQKTLEYAGIVVAGGLLGGVAGICVLGWAIGGAVAAVGGIPVYQQAQAFDKAASCSGELHEEFSRLDDEFSKCYEKVKELDEEMSNLDKKAEYLSRKADITQKMRRLENFYGGFLQAFNTLQDAIKEAKSELD